jgi:hypothetical protein
MAMDFLQIFRLVTLPFVAAFALRGVYSSIGVRKYRAEDELRLQTWELEKEKERLWSLNGNDQSNYSMYKGKRVPNLGQDHDSRIEEELSKGWLLESTTSSAQKDFDNWTRKRWFYLEFAIDLAIIIALLSVYPYITMSKS